MIAKALRHEPRVLFLDEPTAGVDVNLRRDMWALVRRLREKGVTIILTTHYIEEAEEMADRVGVINDGHLFLVEDKAALMRKLGRSGDNAYAPPKPIAALPAALAAHNLALDEDGGKELIYSFDAMWRAHRHSCVARRLRARGSGSRTCRLRKPRWRTSSSAW